MTDTYPIYNGKNHFDWMKLILWVTVIVLAYFLFKSCGKSPEKPKVITGKQVRDTIRLIDAERNRLNDSFNVILAQYDRQIKTYQYNYDNLMADYLNQQNGIDVTLTKPIPDTCKEIVGQLTGQFNSLKKTSAQKDRAASNTINSLTAKSNTQTKLIASKDSSYKKLLKTADTCSQSLTALEKYVKKIKPKRDISVGLSGMTNYVNLKPAIGLGLGYRTRKGLTFDANIYSNKTITVGIKKTLFSF